MGHNQLKQEDMANVDFKNYGEQLRRRVDKWLEDDTLEANRKIAKLLNEANKLDDVKSDKTKVKEIEKQIKKYNEAIEMAKEVGADLTPYENRLNELHNQLSNISYVSIPHKPKTSSEAVKTVVKGSSKSKSQ